MKIYISGKITGRRPEEYRRQFNAAAAVLKATGYRVINPVSINEPLDAQGFKYDDLMHVCYALVDISDAIYMLDGWENSYGARLEHMRAINAGKKIIYESAERGSYEKRIKAGN